MPFTYQLPIGWATTYATPPDGFAFHTLSFEGLDTQYDIKTRRVNGSISGAIVTAKSSATGPYKLLGDVLTATVSAMATPVWPVVSVMLTIANATYRAALPVFTDTDPWLDGPLVKERRSLVVPVSPNNAPHPSLQVIFDVRSFKDATHLIDIQIKNGKSDAVAITFTNLTITINGAVVYGPRNDTQYQGCVQNFTFPVNGHIVSAADPDSEIFFQSGALSRFLATVDNPTNLTSTGEGYFPLQFGALTKSMPSPGGRPELGPYPAVTAQYLMHHGPSQRARMLAEGDLAGSWCGDLREADGVILPRLSDHTVDYAGPSLRGLGTDLSIQGPHLPALTYVPYLVTGKRRYLDSCQAWAATVLWQNWNGPANTSAYSADTAVEYSRQGAKGLLSANYCGEPRGLAWCLRSVADAAFITPDNDTANKSYFSNVVIENMKWLDNYATLPGGGRYNPLFWEMDPGGGDGQYGGVHNGFTSNATWQISYLIFTMRHVAQLGYPTTNAALRRGCTTMIQLMTDAGTDSNKSRIASSNFPRFGTFTTYGTHHMFTTWDEFYYANYVNPAVGDSHDITTFTNGVRDPGPSYYACEYRIYCLIGAELGIPGAAEALNWFETKYSSLGDAVVRSGYALALGDNIITTPPVDPPVDPPATEPVIFTAEITEAAEKDPDSTPGDHNAASDDQASVTVTPVDTPEVLVDLELSVSVDNAAPHKGDTITITVVGTNKGPNASTNSKVTMTIPAGLTFASYTATQGSYSGVVWTVGPLAVGGQAMLLLRLVVS